MAKEKAHEEKLKGVAKRLQSGASVLHSVTENELADVRGAVKEHAKEKAAARERGQERERGR